MGKLITPIHSMHEMDSFIMNLNPAQTILFFDIDNTLFRTKSDIGSVEWVKWQELLVSTNTSIRHEHCVADSLDDLYKYYQKWLTTSNCETELLESYVADLINKYISMEFKIVLMTAREKVTSDVTFEQLSRHYDIKNFYSQNISFENDKNLYKSGVYFAAGVNKGECIKFLLDLVKSDYVPVNIVFIDDSLRECHAVEEKFMDSQINANIFHYMHGKKFQIIFEELNKDMLHQKWIAFNEN